MAGVGVQVNVGGMPNGELVGSDAAKPWLVTMADASFPVIVRRLRASVVTAPNLVVQTAVKSTIDSIRTKRVHDWVIKKIMG